MCSGEEDGYGPGEGTKALLPSHGHLRFGVDGIGHHILAGLEVTVAFLLEEEGFAWVAHLEYHHS